MLTVTADSNIYISALVSGGLPLQSSMPPGQECSGSPFPTPCSPKSWRYYASNSCGRSKRWTKPQSFWPASPARVEPAEMLSVITADPDDDRILECAVTAGAGFIVSGDNHLLRLGRYRDIQSCAWRISWR